MNTASDEVTACPQPFQFSNIKAGGKPTVIKKLATGVATWMAIDTRGGAWIWGRYPRITLEPQAFVWVQPDDRPDHGVSDVPVRIDTIPKDTCIMDVGVGLDHVLLLSRDREVFSFGRGPGTGIPEHVNAGA